MDNKDIPIKGEIAEATIMERVLLPNEIKERYEMRIKNGRPFRE